jgi:nicotinate-nucleotide adenylyltransferase
VPLVNLRTFVHSALPDRKDQISSRPVRIGILGGTFNPIHLGHLRSAEEVRERQHLDRVLFIPSATPPHKKQSEVVTAAHRVAMVRSAIRGNPWFRVSSLEIDRTGRSYTVDTLDALRRTHPRHRFAFILGADAFREIATWKSYSRLFELCDFIVTSRPPCDEIRLRALIPVAARKDFCYRPRRNVLEHRSGHEIVFQRISDFAISSSDIRDRKRRGESIRYLVPPTVESYITRHKLYGRRQGAH